MRRRADEYFAAPQHVWFVVWTKGLVAMTVRDMLDRWRALDERAWDAEAAVQIARAQQAGGGRPPSADLLNQARSLRQEASEALKLAVGPHLSI